MNDTKKIVRGRTIVHSNSRYHDSNNSVGDVLLDLMHYAEADGINFQEELNWAVKAFREDKAVINIIATSKPA